MTTVQAAVREHAGRRGTIFGDAWVMTIRDDRVVRVTAYLDLVALQEMLDRVAPAAGPS